MWKTEYFGVKLGQDLGKRAAHPYQEFRGVPPTPPPRAEAKKHTKNISSHSIKIAANIDTADKRFQKCRSGNNLRKRVKTSNFYGKVIDL